MIINFIRGVNWEGETLLASATTLVELVNRLRSKNAFFGDTQTLEVLYDNGLPLVILDLAKTDIPGYKEFLAPSGPENTDENWEIWIANVKDEIANAVKSKMV